MQGSCWKSKPNNMAGRQKSSPEGQSALQYHMDFDNSKCREHASMYSTYFNDKKGMILLHSLFTPL